MNNIPTQQNTDQSIAMLSAQRYAYNRAKCVLITRFCLSLVFAIIAPIIIVSFEATALYVAITAIAYTLVDVFVLRNIENTYRTTAARIQEEFDTNLFKMKWNSICVGKKVEPETIHQYSQKHQERYSTDTLLNWYPENISSISLNKAVLICQRTNIWWDTSLRKNAVWVSGVSIVAITLSILYAFADNSEVLFGILFSIIPLYEITIDYIRSQVSSVRNMSTLRELTEEHISKLTSMDEPSESELRSIQDRIYTHRSTNLFVPDWFYFFHRDKQEEQMRHSAEHYVNLMNRT